MPMRTPTAIPRAGEYAPPPPPRSNAESQRLRTARANASGASLLHNRNVDTLQSSPRARRLADGVFVAAAAARIATVVRRALQ